MIVYANPIGQPLQLIPNTVLIKTFNVMVWVEMDRVRMVSRYYTLSITGMQCDEPNALTYSIDSASATMQQVADLLAWAKRDGSVEKIAEEAAA